MSSSSSTLISRKAESEASLNSSHSEAPKDLVPAPCIIGTWDQADLYMRDNEYIRKGYRVNFNSGARILKSLFMCHNESTNIWSHLCGAILFAALIVYIILCVVPEDALVPYRLIVGPAGQTANSTY